MACCPQCGRTSPPRAAFCHFDGRALTADAEAARRVRFAAPFVLPSGRACHSFDDIVPACLDEWGGATRLLRDGTFERFLAGIGRTDLARTARDAAHFPDPDLGLDQLLRALPGEGLRPPQLVVAPLRADLGRLRVGQGSLLELTVFNEHPGLAYGTLDVDVPWLAPGHDGPHGRFAFHGSTTIPVRVRGDKLHAADAPQEGRLILTTPDQTHEVRVRLEVPPVPFAAGVLAGARTPRQLAEKAKAAPDQAARHFESGQVPRWYAENGWAYPVEGDPAPGVAGVQQFFDALGLSKPPRLILSEERLELAGKPGGALAATLELTTPDRRPVYARVSSDHAWLQVRGVDLDGRRALIHVSVPQVPDWPGESVEGNLTIVANCRQQLQVPVRLNVAGPAPRLTPVEPPPLPPPGPRRSAGDVFAIIALITGGVLAVIGLMTLLIVVLMPTPAPDTVADATPTERECKGKRGETPEELPRVAMAAPEEKKKEEKPPPAPPPKRTLAIAEDIKPRLPPSVPKVMGVREMVFRPVEVVFCLDTTGSMGGLLGGARAKIWSICSQIARGKPTPELKVGLVAYKDRGDEYVTRVVALSRDLDAIHGELNKLTADGGGDNPEHVNQALDDAVNKIEWSPDERTLKLIFLVGDAPPQMDYTDDVKYPVTCKKAAAKGIIINAMQCGDDADAKKAWKDIASKAGGQYVRIPQEGGVRVVETSYDGELARLGASLYDTALVYGPKLKKDAGEQMLKAARALKGPAAADRAVYAARSKSLGPYDLLDEVLAKRVKLGDVAEEELPYQLKAREAGARGRYLEEVEARRKQLSEAILAVELKRAREVLERRGSEGGGFDGEVLAILRKQAKKFDIEY